MIKVAKISPSYFNTEWSIFSISIFYLEIILPLPFFRLPPGLDCLVWLLLSPHQHLAHLARRPRYVQRLGWVRDEYLVYDPIAIGLWDGPMHCPNIHFLYTSIHQPSIMSIVSNSDFLIHYYFSFFYTVKACGKWRFYEVLRELLSW